MKGNLLRWLHRDRSGMQEPEPTAPMPFRRIPNEELTEADVPSKDATWSVASTLVPFAASFNGYEYWGSFDKCFEVGKLVRTRDLKTLTLIELRTALFCLYRSIVHDGESTAEDDRRAQVMIEEIRRRVKQRAFE